MKRTYRRTLLSVACIFALLMTLLAGCAQETGENPGSSVPETTQGVPGETGTPTEPEPSEAPTEPENGFDLTDVSYDYLIEAGEENTHRVDGFGVQVNVEYFMKTNTAFGIGQADWKVFEDRVKELKVAKFRINILPDYYEPVNDDSDPNNFNWAGFDFDSDYMKALCKVLDVAQSNGVRVNITSYGASKDSWLGYASTEKDAWWTTAPKDLDEYAESMAALLMYLIEEKGYTCIYQFTPYNEPDMGFTKGTRSDASLVDFDLYVDFCVAIHEKLTAVGIRDKIDFNVGDDATNPQWIQKIAQNSKLYEIADSINSHVYKFDSTTNDRTMESYLSQLTGWSGEKPFQILEFGSGQMSDWPITTQFDLETYGRGLMYARTAIQLLNAGGVGYTSWTLFDYMREDQRVMNTGMYGFYTEDWAVRPFYHSYSILSQYARPGMAVYPGTEKDSYGTVMDDSQKDNGVAAVFLKTEDGHWSMLLTNDNDFVVKVKISNTAMGNTALKRFMYNQWTLPGGDERIEQSGTVICEDGVFYVAIPARSFIVLTDMN